MLLAVDCIIFGFDGNDIRLLLIQRGLKPERGKWSLMGGFLQPEESLEQAANRILKKLTGLEGVYMEQLRSLWRTRSRSRGKDHQRRLFRPHRYPPI